MVRPLVPNDQVEVLDIFTTLKSCRDFSTGFDSWSESQFQIELSQSLGLVYEETSIEAFLLYRTIPDGFEIMLVGTHPRRQNQGVMQQVLAVLLNSINPGQIIWLEVHEKNAPALKLYDKMGFKVRGRRSCYYADGAAGLNLEYKAP